MIIGIILLIALTVFLLTIFYSLKNGIVPMPTSPKVKKALLDNFPKDVTGPIYDLGAGWGTLAQAIAKKRPDCHVIGVENSPLPYSVAWIRSVTYNGGNLKLVYRDFYDIPLSDSNLVVCYLFPEAMKRLKVKFEKELKPGTKVVSHTFAIPRWHPQKIITVPDLYQSKIYIYSYPECQSGN